MPVPVPILAEVDHRLRMARGEAHVPFGGLCVILCGDFAQLPPVGARSLMTAVVTQPDDTPRRRRPKTPLSAGNQSGCSLFCLFKRYDLAPREFSFSPAGYQPLPAVGIRILGRQIRNAGRTMTFAPA